MADLIEQILAWPLDQAGTNSYDYFDYDVLKVESAVYAKGGNLTTGTTPTGDGGQWGAFPPGALETFAQGYIDFKGYIQINFTAAIPLDLNSIEFDVSNFFTGLFLVEKFYLAYSLDSSFINQVVIYDYPEFDISTANIPSPISISHTFSMPINMLAGDTVYFRLYPYIGDPTFYFLMLLKNTFFINGVVRPTPTVASFTALKFQKDCTNSNNLTWT